MGGPGQEHRPNNPYQAPTVSLAEDLAREHAGAAAERDTLPIGCRVGGCVIEDLLAEGGQGVVYRAFQEDPGRTVAIKTMRPSKLAPRRVERFLAECALLARNEHPGIVTLHEVGRFECKPGVTAPFLVMGYVSSAMSITEASREYAWPTEKRIEKFLDACRAVSFLHKRGVRHFDIKPANILVDDQQHVRVSDLGLARSYSERLVVAPGGTLTHMSPEQCRGDPDALDHRSDVYSLGVVLYELLSGRLPVEVRDAEGALMDTDAVFDRICLQPPVPLGAVARGADPALAKIVMRCLEKRPGDRFQTVDELIGALEGYLEDSRRSRITGEFVTNRQRIVRAVLAVSIVIVSTVLATTIGGIVGDRTQIVARWESSLAMRFERIPATTELLQTVIIEFGETTDAVALGRQRGLDEVTDAVVSHRALHGELAHALARSGAAAVVFDIVFRRESPYDERFAAGLRALRDAGVGAVVAVPEWTLDEEHGRPILSETLWRVADWGVFEAMITEDNRLWMPLLVVRDRHETLASLALASYAASRAGGANFSFSLDGARRAVDIVYWRPVDDRPGGRRLVGRADRIPLTELAPFSHDATMDPRGKRDGDIIGWYKPVMLSQESLRAATRPYEDVLNASETDLRLWFGGKMVFIGNFTARAGDVVAMGDEDWPGVYLHALTADSLARQVRPVTAGWRMHSFLAFAFALLGGAIPIAVYASRRTARSAVLGAAIVVLTVFVLVPLACAMIYGEFWLLLNPVIPALAVAFTALAAWISLALLSSAATRPRLGKGAVS